LSINRLYQDLHSRGLSIGKDTVYNYINHIEDAFLIYLLPIAERSLRKRSMHPKKLHVVDWTLGYSYKPGQLIDRGRRLENAVFLHHRRQRDDLAYLEGPHEIDLVVGIEYAEAWVSTAWSVTEEETWRRESAILQRHGGPSEHILVTRECAGRRAPDGCKIVEAWRYLLGRQ
jgi:hypothetical protein